MGKRPAERAPGCPAFRRGRPQPLNLAGYNRNMSVAAFLLRLLICVGLLFNGSAQAIAVTQPGPASHQAGAATAPCHEEGDREVTARQFHEHHSGPVTNKPDCCKSGACDCACNHGAVATIPTLLAHGQVKHATLVSRPAAGYASPALPRLIRPPIV